MFDRRFNDETEEEVDMAGKFIGHSTDGRDPGEDESVSRGGGVAATVDARQMTKLRLTRTARGAVIALVLALVWAAPAAAAAPTRTVTHFPADRVGHFPAGTGCTFDVTVYSAPKGSVTVTDFSDGTEVYVVHAMFRTITSDVTGATFVENQEYRDAEWIDATSGLLRGETSGQFIDTFFPGDVGPYGVVDQVVSYSIIGSQTYVLDPNTYATLALNIKGTITNICAAIS
jgi:hypothetical protein